MRACNSWPRALPDDTVSGMPEPPFCSPVGWPARSVAPRQIGMFCPRAVLGEIRAAGPFLADKPRILGYPADAVPGAAGYQLGSDRGSPNHGSTLASKRVMAQIWPPARVST